MTMAPSVDPLRPFALNAVNSNPIPNPPAGASLALGLSVSAWPLLQQLQRSGHTDRVGLTPVAASALETPVSDMVVATAPGERHLVLPVAEHGAVHEENDRAVLEQSAIPP